MILSSCSFPFFKKGKIEIKDLVGVYSSKYEVSGRITIELNRDKTFIYRDDLDLFKVLLVGKWEMKFNTILLHKDDEKSFSNAKEYKMIKRWKLKDGPKLIANDYILLRTQVSADDNM